MRRLRLFVVRWLGRVASGCAAIVHACAWVAERIAPTASADPPSPAAGHGATPTATPPSARVAPPRGVAVAAAGFAAGVAGIPVGRDLAWIDALSGMLRAVTPGPMHSGVRGDLGCGVVYVDDGDMSRPVFTNPAEREHDRVVVCALLNNLPRLLELARRGACAEIAAAAECN